MKTYAITYVYSDVPGFSSIIYEENNRFFHPYYEDNRIGSFKEISLESIRNYMVIESDLRVNANLGDERILAYYCNDNSYIGNESNIKREIKKLIESASIFAASSLIEALEFLDEEYSFTLKAIKDAYTRVKDYYSNYPVHIRNFESIANEYLHILRKKIKGSLGISDYKSIINGSKMYIAEKYNGYYEDSIAS